MRKIASVLLLALTSLAAIGFALGFKAHHDARQNLATERRAAVSLLAHLPNRYSPAGRYVGPLRSNIDPPHIVLSADGIPRVRYGDVYESNPVTAAQYGLWAYGMFLRTRRHSYKRAVIRIADWLVERQQHGRWVYRFDADFNGTDGHIAAPWTSAMAQGQAMSLLERVYLMTSDRRYLRSAVSALAPLKETVAEGGLARCFGGNCRLPFFEEYPTPKPSEVLNGFMFTLIGLYDLASVAPKTVANALYESGRRTLVAALPRYDQGGVARYDLATPQCASPAYQAIHIYLLRTLAMLRPQSVFSRYADRWESHLLHGC